MISTILPADIQWYCEGGKRCTLYCMKMAGNTYSYEEKRRDWRNQYPAASTLPNLGKLILCLFNT